MKKRFFLILTTSLFLALSLFTQKEVSAVSNTNVTPWYPQGMGGNGFFNALDISEIPDSGGQYNIAGGHDVGGAWLSLDKGDSWVSIGGQDLGGSRELGTSTGKDIVNVVKFDPSDPTRKTVFIGLTTKQIMKGTIGANGEYTYETKYTGTQGITTIAFAPSNSQIIYAGSGKIRAFLNTGYDKSKIYVGTPPTIYKSTNGGEGWTAHTIPLTGGYTMASTVEIVVHPSDPNIVFVSTDKGLFKSTGDPNSWDKLGDGNTSPLPHDATFGFALDPNNPDTMYVTLMPYPNIQKFTLDPDSYTGQNLGGVFKSTDGGANWTQLDLGFSPPAGDWGHAGFFYDVAVSSKNSDRVYATYQEASNNDNSGVFRSTDGGDPDSWEKLNNFTCTYLNVFGPQVLSIFPISANEDDIFILGKSAGQYKSTDNGASFVSFASSERSGIEGETYFRGWGLELPLGYSIKVDEDNPYRVFYVDHDRGIWRSIDGGINWRHVFEPSMAESASVHDVFIDPDNSDIIYGIYADIKFRQANTDYPHFLKSTDGGDTWRQVMLSDSAGIDENFIQDLALDPTPLDPNDVDGNRIMYAAACDNSFRDMRIVVNRDEQKYDVYIGGSLATDLSKSFVDMDANSVNKMEFRITNGTGNFYFDNIAVSDVNGSIASYNFNSDTTGGDPNGWTVVDTGPGLVQVSEAPNFYSKSVRVYSPQSDPNEIYKAYTTFADSNSRLIDVKYSMRLEQTSGFQSACNLYDNDKFVAQVVFTGGDIKAKDPNGWEIIGSYVPSSNHTGVYKSVDGGSTWTDISGGLPDGSIIRKIKIDPNNSSILYASDSLDTSGGIYKKIGSNDWTRVFDDKTIAFDVVNNNGNTVIFAGSNDIANHGIYKSTNGGTDWSLVRNSSAEASTYVYSDCMAVDPNEVFMTTSSGALRTINGGASWDSYNENLTYGAIDGVFMSSSSRGNSYYVGMDCTGMDKSTTLPFTVVEYKRSGNDYFLCYPREATDGIQAYPDAAWQINDIPSSMGYLKNLYNFTTCNDDRNNSSSSLTTLELDCTANIYVAVPSGATPSWLSGSGFRKAPDTFSMNYRDTDATQVMDVWYKKNVKPDTLVALGGLKNGNTIADVQYLVFAEKKEYVLFDDFQDNNDVGWTDDSTGTLSVVDDNGNYAYKSDQGSDISYFDQQSWDNYIIEARIKIEAFTAGTVSLMGRYLNINNWYELQYNQPTDTLNIRKKIAGTVSTISWVTLTDLSLNVYHNFAFVLDGSELKGYVDGVLLVTGTDSDRADGYAALRSWNQVDYFDDIYVTEIVTPDTPLLRAAEGGNEEVDLAWYKTDYALGYNLKYGTASGTYTNEIDVGNVSEYTVTGLNDATTYYFAVSAYNISDGSESSNSNEMSAKTAAFFDDFEDGNASDWTVSQGVFNIVNEGTNIAYKSDPNPVAMAYPTGQQEWANCAVQAKIKTEWDASGEYVSLRARVQDSNNFYDLLVSSNNLKIRKKKNGVITTLGNGLGVPIMKPLEGKYSNYTFELDGSTLKGYINGILYTTVSDPDFADGYIAICSYNIGACYDDVMVR